MSDFIQKLLLTIFLLFISNCTTKCTKFISLKKPIYGIDVSHYQSEKNKINWSKVAENNNPKIEFAYIRTTMGSNSIDTAFKYNIKEAQKQNIKTGVYHYFRPNENWKKQFENFHKNNSEIGELPPVIDIEQKGDIRITKLRKQVLKFAKEIEKNYNIKPIIYTQQKFYNMYFAGHMGEYEFWIARQSGITTQPKNNEPQKEPFLLDFKCPLIWQYSGTGVINGINAPVDLNIIREKIW